MNGGIWRGGWDAETLWPASAGNSLIEQCEVIDLPKGVIDRTMT